MYHIVVKNNSCPYFFRIEFISTVNTKAILAGPIMIPIMFHTIYHRLPYT